MNVKEIKKLVAKDELRIKLYDEIANETNTIVSKINGDQFAVNGNLSNEEFERIINEYEETTSQLCLAQITISYWGNGLHGQTIALPFRMIADHCIEKSGRSIGIALKWYNNLLLLYSTGIAAIASERYENLIKLTGKTIIDPKRPNSKTTMLQAIFDVCHSYRDKFQLISGDTNHKVPRSEYLFKELKPKFQELLHLGSDYEFHFDKFETLIALEYDHQTNEDSPEYINALRGRYRYKRRGYDNPLADLIEEANAQKENWLPLKAGLIGGNFNRFKNLSNLLQERLKKSGWGF